MKKSFAGLVGLLSLALPGAAQAATATGTLDLSITITASCSVVSASSINFGSVSTIGSNIDATSTLKVNCSSTTPYQVMLGAGNGSGATVAERKMSSGGNSVKYTLFRDSNRMQIWGNTLSTDTHQGTGTGADQDLTIFARVPAQAVPPPGSYTDTVAITIDY